MKSCPQCDHELTEEAPEICAACGFALVNPQSPTIRADPTIKQTSQNDGSDLSTAPTIKPESELPPVSSTAQTLLVDPMKTMSRPLDDRADNATLPQSATTRAPATKPPNCLLYTSPSPRDLSTSRMPSSA